VTEVKFVEYVRPGGRTFQYSLTKDRTEAVRARIQNLPLFGNVEDAKRYLRAEFHPQHVLRPFQPLQLADSTPNRLEMIAYVPATQEEAITLHHYALNIVRLENVADHYVEVEYLDPIVFDNENDAKDYLKREFHRGIDIQIHESEWMMLSEALLEQYCLD